MSKQSDVDRILDAGLSTYADAQPIEGLEQRILRRVQEPAVHRRPVLLWVGAFAVAAAVVCLIVWPRQPAPPVAARTPDRPEAVRPQLKADVQEPRIVRTKRQRPRQAQFPSAWPLTREERALVSFVMLPAETLPAMANLQREIQIVPLEMQDLQIPPLQTEGLELDQ